MKAFLYSIAKTWLGGLLLHWVFPYFRFLIPGKKLVETDTILAFHHPSPSYPLHIIIVPKASLNSLADLPSDDLAFETALFQAINILVEELDLKSCGYRLIANGGSNQEVNHLHFHLISDEFDDIEYTRKS
jgi:histidine triad (HIT) family protein